MNDSIGSFTALVSGKDHAVLIRLYRMQAQDGQAQAFETAAAALARAVGGCEGSEQVLMARAPDGGYLFIEHWRDEAARTAAGGAIDKSLFGALFATLDGKPEAVDAEVIAQA